MNLLLPLDMAASGRGDHPAICTGNTVLGTSDDELPTTERGKVLRRVVLRHLLDGEPQPA